MEKLKQYQKIIKKVLSDEISLLTNQYPNVKEELVIDAAQRHHLLIANGWHQQHYHYLTVFHLELTQNGKIWSHQVNSDVEIRKLLVAEGIAEEDILSGIIEPYSLEEREEVENVAA
ncbi:MAG: element excision factor XisI family protein [Saprospiraceae bacterium]